jgi:hypothetical protein
VTVLYAVFWSALTDGAAGSSGLLADVTPGSFARSATSPPSAWAFSGVVSF